MRTVCTRANRTYRRRSHGSVEGGRYGYLVRRKLSQSALRMLGRVCSWFPPTPVWSQSLYCRGCGPFRLFLALVMTDIFPGGLDWFRQNWVAVIKPSHLFCAFLSLSLPLCFSALPGAMQSVHQEPVYWGCVLDSGDRMSLRTPALGFCYNIRKLWQGVKSFT